MRLGLVLILACACSCDSNAFDNETGGNRDVMRFSYAGLDCLFGCKLEQPMLVGSNARINMESIITTPLTAIEVGFFPDGVAEIVALEEVGDEPTQRSVNIRSISVGTTVLHVQSEDEPLVDYVEIEVAEVAEIGFAFHVNDSSTTTSAGEVHELRAGQTGLIFPDLFDASGRRLMGTSGAVSWTLVAGENIITLRNPKVGESATEAIVLAVDALAVGTARIRAQAHEVQVEFEVRVF